MIDLLLRVNNQRAPEVPRSLPLRRLRKDPANKTDLKRLDTLHLLAARVRSSTSFFSALLVRFVHDDFFWFGSEGVFGRAFRDSRCYSSASPFIWGSLFGASTSDDKPVEEGGSVGDLFGCN